MKLHLGLVVTSGVPTQWVDGTTYDFSNWHSGAPAVKTEGVFAGITSSASYHGLWSTQAITGKAVVLCQQGTCDDNGLQYFCIRAELDYIICR